MDDSRVLNKLDKVENRLDKIDVHLAVYNEQLKVHILGTIDNRADIVELKKSYYMVKGVLICLSGIVTVVGFLVAVKELFT